MLRRSSIVSRRAGRSAAKRGVAPPRRQVGAPSRWRCRDGLQCAGPPPRQGGPTSRWRRDERPTGAPPRWPKRKTDGSPPCWRIGALRGGLPPRWRRDGRPAGAPPRWPRRKTNGPPPRWRPPSSPQAAAPPPRQGAPRPDLHTFLAKQAALRPCSPACSCCFQPFLFSFLGRSLNGGRQVPRQRRRHVKFPNLAMSSPRPSRLRRRTSRASNCRGAAPRR